MKIDDKVDAVYIPDSPSRIKANDYNQIKNEIQDCITEAGLTPTKDVIQLPQALKILTAQSGAEEVAKIEAAGKEQLDAVNTAGAQAVQDAQDAANTATSKAAEASGSATDAAGSASAAASSASAATQAAESASESATSASTSATNAQTWAEGADSAVTPLGGNHSAKGWASIAKQYSESIGAALKYKGSVATYSTLPSTGQEIGDTWNVLDTGDNYAWTGTEWDKLSGTVDLSAYRTSADQDIIDATKATKAELSGYLPLTGGIINGELKIVGPKSTIITYSGNETSGYTYLELKAADNNQALIALTNNTGETRFRQKGKDTVINNLTYNKSLIISSALTFDNNKVLDASDKAVANGVASLDANAKVPTEQIPVATYSALGGVKPDGTTITVTEDGAISAAISGEVFATKAELQALDSSKADTSLSNVLANIDYVVESQVNSDGSWYRKYKSGWLEQGGLAKSNADVTVTLLKPFADTNYSVQCTNRRLSTSDGWGWIFVLNMTATSFMARACYAGGDTTNIRAMWEAKGQGAK